VLVDSSRVTYGLSRLGVLPRGLGEVHKRFRTPVWALLVLAFIPVLALVLYLSSGSTSTAVVDIASAGGLLFATYYCAVALFCAYAFRHSAVSSLKNLVLTALPLLGGIAVIYVIIKSVPTEPKSVLWIWIVLSLIGIPIGLAIKTAKPKLQFFDRADTHAFKGLVDIAGEDETTPT
jgi:amino acid transporter